MIKKVLSSRFFIFFIVTFVCIIAYTQTTSLRLTSANFGNDGGDFLAAILTKGVPHPTGYPTYTVLGILFQFIPIGDEYYRVAMLSWLPAALGAGLLSLWILDFLKSESKKVAILCAMIGGVVWGTLPFLWSQAVIVEVHGLQSLFLVMAIWWVWLLINYESKNQSNILLVFFAFVFGLALGNHITVVFFLPVIIAAFINAFKNHLPLKIISFQIVGFLFGVLIYLYLPLRAATFPPINWGNPQSWEGFLWVISGGPYQGLVANISFSQLLDRFSALAGILLDQFSVIGVIVAIIGAIHYQHKSKIFSIGLLYLFIVSSLFAMLYATDDSITYLLTAFLVFTLWIVFAIDLILPFTYQKFHVGIIIAAVLVITLIAKVPSTIQEVFPRNQTQPADYAESILKQLPENSILLTTSDPDSFPLWYYHFGLGWRNDLRIIVLPLTQYRWYQETLINTYNDLHFPPLINQFENKNQTWGETIPSLNADRTICRSSITESENRTIMVQCTNNLKYQFSLDD